MEENKYVIVNQNIFSRSNYPEVNLNHMLPYPF